MALLTIQTPLGTLKGTEYVTDRGENILCWLGVPYAKPPVGDLRFKDPVPIEPWSGVKSAEKSPPPAATAFVLPGSDKTMELPGSSEDCLYLNIYKQGKTLPGVKLPVFVWIHGGGFTCGSGNKEFYSPDYLVPNGVLFIAINYRVGPFGFLSFENKECSGNYGLKDQNLALKWIQENVTAFGGDPENVTLTGESAGAASVQYHMLSPLSRGLFHRAIAMSGSALNRWAYSRHARKSSFLLAKKLGYTGSNETEALEILKKATTGEILMKTIGVFEEIEGLWAGEKMANFAFVPTAEPVDTPNAFLTKEPSRALADGDYMDIPYITGICQEESIFLLPSADFIPNDDDIKKLLPKELELPLGSQKMITAHEKLKKFYFPNGPTQEGYLKALSATFTWYGVYKTVEAHRKNPKKTSPDYLYIFNPYRQPSQIKSLFNVDSVKGCSHADDLAFIFKSSMGIDPNESPAPIEPGSKDEKVMQAVTKLYTDFAKTGQPNIPWPVADPAKQYPYLDIDTQFQVKNQFKMDEVKFWDELYEFLRN